MREFAPPLSRPPPDWHVLSPSSPPSTSATLLEQRRLVHVFLGAVFTYVFLANAWLGDDAYITFRVVWNFVHGYGPVFNPGERVQAYTHPLWMLVMSAAHFVTRDFFFTAQAVSYGFVLAALLRIARRTESAAAAAVVFVWVLSSKAFMDYASSGLEYPLSYCLLAFFYTRWFAVADRPLETRDLRRFGFVAGLAFVNRIDSALLYALPLAWLALRTLRADRVRLAALVTGFAVPAGAWLLFATIYYGFPLPNTYYAKVATGIPSSLLYQQGLAYLFNSLAHDPVTVTSIGFAAALAARGDGAARAAAGSALLYVVYTVSVGGDFMSGRFFAMPFLVSVMVAVRLLAGMAYQPVALGTLLLYNLLTPLAPVKVGPGYDAGWPWRTQNGVRDEHGHSHQGSNPLTSAPFRQLPDHTWVREGVSFRNGPEKVTVQGSIGAYGLFAGPDRHLVDSECALGPAPRAAAGLAQAVLRVLLGPLLPRHPGRLSPEHRDRAQPAHGPAPARLLRPPAPCPARPALQQRSPECHLVPERRPGQASGGRVRTAARDRAVDPRLQRALPRGCG